MTDHQHQAAVRTGLEIPTANNREQVLLTECNSLNAQRLFLLAQRTELVNAYNELTGAYNELLAANDRISADTQPLESHDPVAYRSTDANVDNEHSTHSDHF
jgi:hypothetical protein